MANQDITQTGPQSGSQLQDVNNEPFLSKKERKEWLETFEDKSYYEEFSTTKIKNGQFVNPKLERKFRDAQFRKKFHDMPDYAEWSTSLTDEEADNLYLKYRSAEEYQVATASKNKPRPSINTPFLNEEDQLDFNNSTVLEQLLTPKNQTNNTVISKEDIKDEQESTQEYKSLIMTRDWLINELTRPTNGRIGRLEAANIIDGLKSEGKTDSEILRLINNINGKNDIKFDESIYKQPALTINQRVQQAFTPSISYNDVLETSDYIEKKIARDKKNAEDAELRKQKWISEFMEQNQNLINTPTTADLETGEMSPNISESDLMSGAKAYAARKEQEFKQRVHPLNNPYRNTENDEDLKRVMMEQIEFYNKFHGTALLPDNEIDFDEIRRRIQTANDENRVSAVNDIIQVYLETIADDHQMPFKALDLGDGRKYHSSARTAFGEAAGNFVEGTLDFALQLGAYSFGALKAIYKPEEWQLDADMNYLERMVDNATHARLGHIGPGAGASMGELTREWIKGEDQTLGHDCWTTLNKFVIPLTGYLTAFSLGGLADAWLMAGMKFLSKPAAEAVLRHAARKKIQKDIAKRGLTKEIEDGFAENLMVDQLVERASSLLEAKSLLYHNRIVNAAMTVKAASAEAIGEAAQTEGQIMQQAVKSKQAIADNAYKKYYDDPNLGEFTNEEYINAYNAIAQQWLGGEDDIEKALQKRANEDMAKLLQENPDVNYDMPALNEYLKQQYRDEISKQTQALAKVAHDLAKDEPLIDRAYAAQAARSGLYTYLLNTIFIAAMEGYCGGTTSRLGPYSQARKAAKKTTPDSDLSKVITYSDGKFHYNAPTGKMLGKAAVERGKDMASEVIQESGQGFIGSWEAYKGEHSAEEFVNNHFFGDGSLTLEHYTKNNPSLQYLVDDSHLGEVAWETAIGTALTGAFSGRKVYNSAKRHEARREGESKFRYAVKTLADYLPFDSPITQTISEIMHKNDEGHDFVRWANNYYSLPQNQDKLKSANAVVNYALKIQKDAANGDRVAYEDDAFSMTLAEAIMLNRLQDSPVYQARLQQLKNMADIKNGNDEQKAAAIQDWREHATTQEQAKMSDEEILDAIETNGKRVLNLYDKVGAQNRKLDEKYQDGLSFEDRANMLFGIFANEDLEERVKDRKKHIQEVIASVENEDLGESRKVEEGQENENSKVMWDKKETWKFLQMSGQDLLKLSDFMLPAIFAEENRKYFSEEQQKIIEKTLEALRANDKDLTFIQDIRDVHRMEVERMFIKAEYMQSLKNIAKPPKSFNRKKKETEERISKNPDKYARRFQNKILNAQNIQEVRSFINEEIVENDKRRAKKRFDIQKALDDIKDPEIRKHLDELKKIERAARVLTGAINRSELSDPLKESLSAQIENMAANTSNAESLYNIDNYSIDVLPDEQDRISGIIQTAINAAKSRAEAAQNVNTDHITEQKGATQMSPANDLGARDVASAPPVNNEPITKLTVEEAKRLLQEAQALLVTNYVEASHIIDQVKYRCPEGYTVYQTGNSVLLVKLDSEESVGDTQVDEELESIDFDDYHVIIDEELDDSLDSTPEEIAQEEALQQEQQSTNYDDKDIRSVTKVAVGRYREDGPIYTFPIRDEQVDANTRVQSSFTDKRGQVHTGKSGPLEIMSVEEYNRRSQEDPATYKPLQEIVENNPRPTFININQNQIPSTESSSTNKGNKDISDEDLLIDFIDNLLQGIDRTKAQMLPSRDLFINLIKLIQEAVQDKDYEKLNNKIDDLYGHLNTIIQAHGVQNNTKQKDALESALLAEDNVLQYIIPIIINFSQQVNILEESDKLLHVIAERKAKVGDTFAATPVEHKSVDGLSNALPKVAFSDGTTNWIKSIYLKLIENNSLPSQKSNKNSSRTNAQQNRLANNITPARKEISDQFLPQNRQGQEAVEKDRKYERLGDEAHRNIDAQLEDNGAFEYLNSGALEVGDKIVFVVSEETMPDGRKGVVIWEVTDPKGKTLPKDGKFKGKQVLSVLDQTNADGARAELITRIREAYEKAGRPDSFLYDQEEFSVGNLVNGIIPFKLVNPTTAQSDETIESTNLKKGFTKKKGRFGLSFWSKKKGAYVHTPVILKQTRRDSRDVVQETFSQDLKSPVDTVKHEYASQNATSEVMLVVPTVAGWKAAHSVYVMRRNIANAIDKYKEAINRGRLGQALINRIVTRMTDPKARTFFSDFFKFRDYNVGEYIKYDPTHQRLELGYTAGGNVTTLVYASRNPNTNKWYITEMDARRIIDNNNGQEFTFEEVCKKYLEKFVEDEIIGASIQININAAQKPVDANDPKGERIIDALIGDGFLWAPNSINARFGMENTAFEAPLTDSQPITPEPKEEHQEPPKNEPKTPPTAPIEKAPTADTPKSNTPKKEVSKTNGDVALRPKRKKLTAASSKKVETAPTSQLPIPNILTDDNNVTTAIKTAANKSYDELSSEDKQLLEEKKLSKEDWNRLTPLERENALNC